MKQKDAVGDFVDLFKNNWFIGIYLAVLQRARSKKDLGEMVKKLPIDVRIPDADVNRVLKPAWDAFQADDGAFGLAIGRMIEESKVSNWDTGMARYYRKYVDRERSILDCTIDDDMCLIKYTQESAEALDHVCVSVCGVKLYVYMVISTQSNQGYVLISDSRTGANENSITNLTTAEEMIRVLAGSPRYRLRVSNCYTARDFKFTPIRNNSTVLTGCALFGRDELRSFCNLANLNLASVNNYGSTEKCDIHYQLPASKVDLFGVAELVSAKLGINGEFSFGS